MSQSTNSNISAAGKARLAEVVGEHRRLHRDSQTMCSNCHTPGAEDHRLSKCSGCQSVWYCGRECQRSNWKIHKPFCLQHKAKMATLPRDEQKLIFALKDWTFAHSTLLNFAADNLLLPSSDRPDNLLFDTHVFFVQLKETPEGSGELVVIHADAVPLETLSVIPALKGAYESIMEKKKEKIPEYKGTKSSKVLGVTWTLAFCHPALRICPALVTEEGVEICRRRSYNEGWLDHLKYGTLPGSRQFVKPEGEVFSIGPDITDLLAQQAKPRS